MSAPATASSSSPSGPLALPSPRADPGFVKQPDGSFAFQPLSARIVAGAVYAYTAFTHCGLTPTTFDFDGSFWDVAVAGESGQLNPPAGFGNPEDGGTIVLVAPNEAIFTSSSGIAVPLVRADGPRSGFPCD